MAAGKTEKTTSDAKFKKLLVFLMKTENQMLRNGKSANCNEKRSQKIAKTAQDSSLTFVTSGVS